MMCVWNHGKYSKTHTHTHNQISVRFPSNYCYYYGERNDKKKKRNTQRHIKMGKKRNSSVVEKFKHFVFHVHI